MRVLIAIDDSEYSRIVVGSVLNNCWPTNIALQVITVLEPLNIQHALSGADYFEALAEVQRDLAKHCRKFLNSQAELLENKFGANKVTSKIIEGEIVPSILDEASDWNADLIVLGSHGRSGFQKLFLGSVADKVISRAHCSVQIVKPKLKS